MSRSFELWLPAFDAARFRVLLCSRQGRSEAAERRFLAVGVQPFYLGYGKMDPRNLFKLIALLRREKVDLIHAHGYGACTWGRIAGLLLGLPVIVHERCNYGTVPGFQRPVEWVLGRFTRCAFAVSESTRRFTIEKRHIRPEAVQTLYSGIPFDHLHAADTAWISDFRRSQGAGPETRVLGVVGRLESHKGHLDAFRALQRVRQTHPDVVMWVVGDGRYQETLQTWVAEQGMGDAIRFLGYRSDVISVIQCFDLQIFPSHQEGTPNTLYEAMAVGAPVVASTADGQGEVLTDERDALMFPPGDEAKMAVQIVRMLDDAALRARLHAALRIRARDFDMKNCIRTLEATYTRLAAASAS